MKLMLASALLLAAVGPTAPVRFEADGVRVGSELVTGPAVSLKESGALPLLVSGSVVESLSGETLLVSLGDKQVELGAGMRLTRTEDGFRLSTHGMPFTMSAGKAAPHANLFVAQWRTLGRPLVVKEDRLEKTSPSSVLFARTQDVEWVQFRLNDREDDIDIVQPVRRLRPRDGKLFARPRSTGTTLSRSTPSCPETSTSPSPTRRGSRACPLPGTCPTPFTAGEASDACQKSSVVTTPAIMNRMKSASPRCEPRNRSGRTTFRITTAVATPTSTSTQKTSASQPNHS